MTKKLVALKKKSVSYVLVKHPEVEASKELIKKARTRLGIEANIRIRISKTVTDIHLGTENIYFIRSKDFDLTKYLNKEAKKNKRSIYGNKKTRSL